MKYRQNVTHCTAYSLDATHLSPQGTLGFDVNKSKFFIGTPSKTVSNYLELVTEKETLVSEHAYIIVAYATSVVKNIDKDTLYYVTLNNISNIMTGDTYLKSGLTKSVVYKVIATSNPHDGLPMFSSTFVNVYVSSLEIQPIQEIIVKFNTTNTVYVDKQNIISVNPININNRIAIRNRLYIDNKDTVVKCIETTTKSIFQGIVLDSLILKPGSICNVLKTNDFMPFSNTIQ